MPRRSFSRSRRSGPKRKLVWTRVSTLGTSTADTTASLDPPTRIDLLAPFEAEYGSDVLGSTLVRTRGLIRIFDTDLAAGEVLMVRAGIYVGNQNEITRGPDVNDNAFDADSAWKDWLFNEPFVSISSSVASESYDLTGRVIDNKASRKIEELNQTLIFDLSAKASAGPSFNYGFYFDFSMLLMLP